MPKRGGRHPLLLLENQYGQDRLTSGWIGVASGSMLETDIQPFNELFVSFCKFL
jgi:hypothetical protein